MDYDDNFDMSSIANLEIKKDGKSLSADSSSQTPSLNPDQIVVLVLHKLGWTYRQPYGQQNYTPAAQQGPQRYIQTTGNAPTKKWCQACGENYTHDTPECHHIVRLAKEQELRANTS